MDIKLIQLQSHGDDRGSLVVIEENKNVPFSIKRVYYLLETKVDERRGFHAHKQLQQFAVVIKGSCSFLLDDGKSKVNVVLNKPSEGLCIDPLIWHEMFDFSDDCVLMVLADAFYDEGDYVRDYGVFLNMINGSEK